GAGYALGIIGGSLMLVLLAYSLRKRWAWLEFLGSTPSWFRFHMVLGIAGPLAILYHCNFSTGATNSNVALFSMLTVAGSGIIGRYIYAHIHNGLYGRKLEFGELRAGADSLRSLSGRISFVPELVTHIESAEQRVLKAGGRAEAVNTETLLMPGKLSTAHVKYVETCSLCHDRSDRGKQTQLCLDCHKEIAGDLHEHSHFHGRFPGIDVSECRACHAEHLGRTADIVKLSHEQFDHEHTDYPLRGAHVDVVCESCHAAGKPFRDAKKECIACHRKEEPHEGKLGRDCGSCHDESAWRHISYDHDKTAFPLRDKHAEAPCAACHFGNRYKNTP